VLKIGITGGIGSGKTTACRFFEALGVPVYYADDRAKWLMQHHPHIRQALIERFGPEAYLPDGSLNRPHLAQIVFSQAQEKAFLDGLVHPIVAQDAQDWQTAQAAQGHAYTLKEAALLFESGSYRQLDKIIVVSAPLELRIQRSMARDNSSEEAIRQRIANQMPQEEKEARADFVLQNLNLEDLQQQVQALHQHLLQLAQS
jgi:dephospho-CoA kinase